MAFHKRAEKFNKNQPNSEYQTKLPTFSVFHEFLGSVSIFSTNVGEDFLVFSWWGCGFIVYLGCLLKTIVGKIIVDSFLSHRSLYIVDQKPDFLADL